MPQAGIKIQDLVFSSEIICQTKSPERCQQDLIDKTRSAVDDICRQYLIRQRCSPERIEILDSFYFIFNESYFEKWHRIDWWGQREILKRLQPLRLYKERAAKLLAHSGYSKYFQYQVERISDELPPLEAYARRRERLFLKEAYENCLDSISYAACFTDKYQGILPAFLMMIFQAGQTEEILVADNGIGRTFFKPYRGNKVWRFLFKKYKHLRQGGAYYLGGMHLGLITTYGRLSCFGSGAVVDQTPARLIYKQDF